MACRTPTRGYDFDPNRVLEVEIEIDEDDWGALRHQHRCPFDDYVSTACPTSNFPAPYTWRTATVTIDGTTLERVAIRKKGFGSTFVLDRPGLKLSIDRYVEDRRWQGLERLTLNTTNDPIRTCLAYELLRNASVPTPRCTFANVRVNGNELGIYPVVESIDGRFLRQHFDSGGALYEGVINDFRADHRPVFERKKDPNGEGRRAIERLTELLAAEAVDLAELDTLVDVDSFLTFWATEVLIARWDGYAGHTNNFFLYRAPHDQRLHFIPWGGNRSTFQRLRDPVLSTRGVEMPTAVIAHGVLARRIYESPIGRERYERRLRTLMETMWNEERLLARIEQMEQMLAPYPGERRPLDQLKQFVKDRRAAIDAELAAGLPDWTFPPPASACVKPAGIATGRFRTTWTATAAADRKGPAELSIALDDGTLDIDAVTAVAGTLGLADVGTPIPRRSDRQAAIVIHAKLPNQRLELWLVVSRARFRSGETIEFGASQSGCGAGGPPYGVACVKGETPCRKPAVVHRGVLTLDEAGTEDGAVVSGSFRAELVRHPWGLFEDHPNIWDDGPPTREWIQREMR